MKKLPTILLVDDDEDYLTVAERALRRGGIEAEIHVAHDGGEVLRQLGLAPEGDGKAGANVPTVILLDLSMPVHNGWEVLRRIRDSRETREIPVVIVSSSDRPADVQKSYELGANSFVVKRYDSEKPGAFLADAVRYWIELNEPPPSTGARRSA